MFKEVVDFNSTADEAIYERTIMQQKIKFELATLKSNTNEIKNSFQKNTNEFEFNKKEIEKFKDATGNTEYYDDKCNTDKMNARFISKYSTVRSSTNNCKSSSKNNKNK